MWNRARMTRQEQSRRQHKRAEKGELQTERNSNLRQVALDVVSWRSDDLSQSALHFTKEVLQHATHDTTQPSNSAAVLSLTCRLSSDLAESTS